MKTLKFQTRDQSERRNPTAEKMRAPWRKREGTMRKKKRQKKESRQPSGSHTAKGHEKLLRNSVSRGVERRRYGKTPRAPRGCK